MKILGIDPGTGRLGWAVLEKSSSKHTLLSCGCLESPKNTPLPERLTLIYDHVSEVISSFKPDVASVEELFYSNNAKTVMSVSAARGVVILACHRAGLPVFNYNPMQVKTSITGYGRADKTQMQQMVAKILCLKEIPKPDDAADAAAVALTHAFTNSVLC